MRIEAVRTINAAYARAWSFDETDLGRPHADRVLRDLIESLAPGDDGRLAEEFFGLGPLAPLVADARVTEILVDGADGVWFERAGTLAAHDDRFLSDLTFRRFVERLGTEAGLKVDLTEPFADGHWRGFRVHLGRAPFTRAEYHLTLRRTPECPWTLEALRSEGWCDDQGIEVLRTLVRERRNVIVLGPTGAGKTSVLNALLREIAPNDRAVILEDTSELARPNAASTKLLTRSSANGRLPEVTLGDLLRQALRMRPDRLVVGEVRGPEAKDLLLSLGTGHAGSFGTLHAGDARQALLRLEMLTQLGAPQWSIETIRRLIHSGIDAWVTCGFEGGRRRLGGVARTAGMESFGILLESVI